MTFREMLQQEHPECVGQGFDGGCKDCPSDYGYEKNKEILLCEHDGGCYECWDREMPGTERGKGEDLMNIESNVGKAVGTIPALKMDARKALREAAEKAREFDVKMASGEWVRIGDVEWRGKKDGGREFRYVGPTLAPETPDKPAPDPVNAPSHYNAGGYECWEVMEAVFGKEAVYHFALCNAWKYLWRAGKKDDLLQDLRKAAKNLEKAIEVKEKQSNGVD